MILITANSEEEIQHKIKILREKGGYVSYPASTGVCGALGARSSLGTMHPGPGSWPGYLPIMASEKAWVPGELRQAATSGQAPASALSPLIGHPERAKSQLGVSPAGDLSNESRKAGGGWGCWGCQGVQIAHYHHKKHLVV